jgi:hypothetical protein
MTGTKSKPAKPNASRPHPGKKARRATLNRRAYRDARRRAEKRRRAIEAGEIT